MREQLASHPAQRDEPRVAVDETAQADGAAGSPAGEQDEIEGFVQRLGERATFNIATTAVLLVLLIGLLLGTWR